MDISLHSEVISKFRQWYDAVWLGDEEHGQTIPHPFSDARYVEYMDRYALALGAWVESVRQTANLNLLAVVPETLVVPDGYVLMPIEPTTGICKAPAVQEGWCDGCSPDNCVGCGPAAPAQMQPKQGNSHE